MSQTKLDRLSGGILLVVAIVWTAGVIWSIPGGDGEGQIGPRGFPLGMGILLGILSLFLIAGSIMNGQSDAAPADEDTVEAPRTPRQAHEASLRRRAARRRSCRCSRCR